MLSFATGYAQAPDYTGRRLAGSAQSDLPVFETEVDGDRLVVRLT